MPQTDAPEQCLWTLQIRGPEFAFQSKGNPGVVHTGGVSVAHLVLSKREVGAIKLLASQAGCTVTAWPMEGQTEEQAEERTRFVGLGEMDRVWPTPSCPTCPWFDPLQEGSSCGLDSLPAESVDELLRTSDLHTKAQQDCRYLNSYEPSG